MPNYHTFRDWPKVTFNDGTVKKTFKKPKKPKNGYSADRMTYDGATGYYNFDFNSFITQERTAVGQFEIAAFTGGGVQTLLEVSSAIGNHSIFKVVAVSSDHATVNDRSRVYCEVQNSVDATIARVYSESTVIDGKRHAIYFTFDRVAGTAELLVDGTAEDQTGGSRVAPSTAGTLNTGTFSTWVGVDSSLSNYLDGKLGYVGISDESDGAIPVASTGADFFRNKKVVEIDEATWNAWNTQPRIWVPDGDFSNNRGTVTRFNYTKNGLILGPVPEDFYDPGMMTFNGTNGYYNKAYTSSGNKVTAILRTNSDVHASTGVPIHIVGAVGWGRMTILITTDGKVTVQCITSTGVKLLNFKSENVVDDGEHIVFASFDGDNGLATFKIDGVDADDVTWVNRIAPTIGTLDAGAGNAYFGRSSTTAYYDGDMGYCGYRETYLTNWSDFMDGNQPKILDEAGWTEWGGQPEFWSAYGLMTDNQGSAGNMTKNGTITGPT